MTPPIDAHVRLDTHPTHPSAVTAVLTGTQAHFAHLGLEAVRAGLQAGEPPQLIEQRLRAGEEAGPLTFW